VRRNARVTDRAPPGPSGSKLPWPVICPRSLIPVADTKLQPVTLCGGSKDLKSIMVPVVPLGTFGVQRKMLSGSSAYNPPLLPTTCPSELIAHAVLPFIPGKAPRFIMLPVDPFAVSGVQRNAYRRTSSLSDISLAPTTCPRELISNAVLYPGPGKSPRSTINPVLPLGVVGVHKNGL
jgi:hypothetical protein